MIIRTVTAIPFNDYNLTVEYEDLNGDAIPQTASVPKDTGNLDYRKVLEWIEDGNSIADAPVLDAD
tara:strand:- start:39 stop:236 length:198 start_codon:yes stop_codon:yes gene_type:complete